MRDCLIAGLLPSADQSGYESKTVEPGLFSKPVESGGIKIRVSSMEVFGVKRGTPDTE
jgi:hypothetical protein